MAPATKRKAIDDDFIHTISDNEADLGIELEEPDVAPPPKKKTKTKPKAGKAGKKPAANRNRSLPEDEADADADAEARGIWGKNDQDDGAIDSDFEFIVEDNGGLAGDFEGWGFDGARSGIDVDKKGVDLDEIIKRRREKARPTNGLAVGKEVSADGPDPLDVDADVDVDMDLDLDDDADGVLADDAFGMIAGPDDDEDADGRDDEAQPDSDDESAVSSMSHPDDSDDDPDNDDSDDDPESDPRDPAEDPDEQARQKAFFAPGEQDPSPAGTVTSFQHMSLSRPILRGLAAIGYTKPTPIQSKAIPLALLGRDIVGSAVTGSGKTVAFLAPILERLLFRSRKLAATRVAILTPTRELAMQCHAVATKLAVLTDVRFCLAVGGLSLKVQEAELRLRPDVIIATPGRFIDHMRNSARFPVDTIEILVLDEADRMLDDGFADELDEIMKTLPKSRQTMLFSATMTSSVDRLIRAGLTKPVRVMVDGRSRTVGTLVQEFVRLRPGRESKRLGYLAHLCKHVYSERVIIFFRQKKDAHRARIVLSLLGFSCAELHGSMNQTQRIANVEQFRDGKASLLCATDLASRGLDIKGVDTVINYDGPANLDVYLHRVGRTARAGRTGTACTLAAEPDRKVVKAAVKAGKAQGAKISSRVIDPAEADRLQAEIDGLADEVEEILAEEKEEKQLANVEMQLKKGENMMEHEAEIKSRPRRTWFESERDKQKARDAGNAEINGLREEMKRKGAGHLSNKDKKRLDLKAERAQGRTWTKGSAERRGHGVLDAVKMKGGGRTGESRDSDSSDEVLSE